tara:strand:+ start:836 stop:961 length:126 start_codon:yes stop_codon:yes gene_type:complete
MPAPIPSARARKQRERSKDVCDDITNAVRARDERRARWTRG